MPDRKRLLILSGSFPDIRCGVSRHTDIISRLTAQQSDYEVHVLTSDEPAVDPGIAQQYQVHPRIRKWGPCHCADLCREILRLKPDIVHIQNPTVKYNGWRSLTMSVLAPLLKRQAPTVRLVVTQHDIALSRKLLRRRFRPLFRAADAVLVSNHRDYQAVRDQKINPAKIYCSPVGSHLILPARTPAAKAAARTAMDIPQQKICVAYFGFVHPGRRIDVLVRALHLLRAENYDIHGLIMGGAYAGQKNYYRQCQQLAQQLQLAEHITWTGYADEKQIIDGLIASDAFVSLPERGADMRNTSIHSAVLAELPVVTTRNPRYYEDPDLEKLGCVCVAGDNPAAVAEGISGTIKNPPPAESLTHWRKQLDPEAIWARHIEVNINAYRGEPPSPPGFLLM